MSSNDLGENFKSPAIGNPVECPICFETYKIPRYLPCFHTFCHDCLSSYIVTTCKQKKTPVGFRCPLCLDFVPAPAFCAQLENWAELIPINETVKLLCENLDKICEACKREDEVENASDWCKACAELLCKSCAKAHRRSIATRDHKIIAITDLHKLLGRYEDENTHSFCRDHNKKVKYFCVDHEAPCCTRCVCTEHRKCRQIDTVEEAAQNLQQSQDVNNLLQEVQDYSDALIKAKNEGNDNVKVIEDTIENVTQDFTELKDKIVTHVETLFEKYLSDLARDAKESKEKLALAVGTFSDRQHLMDRFSRTLKEVLGKTKSPSVLVAEYFKIKEQFSSVTQLDVSKVKITLRTHPPVALTNILQVSKFADFELELDLSGCLQTRIDMANATMHTVCELLGSEGDITGGCFLQNGDIILANSASLEYCFLHYNKSELKRKVKGDERPRDVLSYDHESLVVSFIKGVEKLSMYGFSKLKELFAKDGWTFALAYSSGFIYCACSTFIVKLDIEGNIVKKYATKEHTISVAISKDNEIISASCFSHGVTMINEEGQNIFYYTHDDLKYPCGLDVNFNGNIFVAGKDSNNIHVLSPKGSLLKIFNVTSPRCIKFMQKSHKCFVGTDKGNTKVYEFKSD